MGHSSINVSLTYLIGLEVAELTEDDIAIALMLFEYNLEDTIDTTHNTKMDLLRMILV